MNLSSLDPKLIAAAAVVILMIILIAWLYQRKRRSKSAGLRHKFGREYERAVLEAWIRTKSRGKPGGSRKTD